MIMMEINKKKKRDKSNKDNDKEKSKRQWCKSIKKKIKKKRDMSNEKLVRVQLQLC